MFGRQRDHPRKLEKLGVGGNAFTEAEGTVRLQRARKEVTIKVQELGQLVYLPK